MRPLIYGAAPLESWPPGDAEPDSEPWVSFADARRHVHIGEQCEAIAMWKQIAATKGIESRHVLQAWHFLRDAGVTPPPEVALVQAAVAEVAANDQHDLLVAYRDGSARYLNHGGEVVVVDHVGLSALDDAVAAWLAVAEQLAQVLGVWDQAELPALPRGHTRVLMLTPAGPRFGQGPDDQLRADAGAASFLAAATLVLKVMTNLT